MPTIDLSHGTVNYRVAGPDGARRPPVVFVHGFLVNGSLWDGVAAALATRGIRSYAPDWPLGSHPIALNDTADQSPRGVARQVIAFLEALGLDEVTLVGNDTGGAICQLVLDTDGSRIGRLVLTNCDAFDTFPPKPFDRMFKVMRRPALLHASMQPMRLAGARRSVLGYGGLVTRPLDAAQTRAWTQPCLRDAGVRRDTARFCQGVEPAELLAATNRLADFDGPALLVWGAADRFFKVDLARRIQALLRHGRLVEIPDGKTFLPLDEPERVAAEVTSAVAA